MPSGSARYAHHDAIYDLTVDTTTMTPEQEAARLDARGVPSYVVCT